MPKEQIKPNLSRPLSTTVMGQVRNAFCDALANEGKLQDIAERFRTETDSSEEAVRKALFGDQE